MRYKLTLEYDGTGLCGWQRQDSGPSVQALLEDAVQKFCGEVQGAVCAGRTDSGVHALAQVVHIDLPKDYDPHNVQQGINFHMLPEMRVAVVAAQRVADDFHARFSATKRSYLYRIVNRRVRLAVDRDRAWHVIEPLDAQLMHAAAQSIVGHHDFSTFRDSRCQAKSPEKTLERLDVLPPLPLGEGRGEGSEIHIIAEARSFLHHQVRNMVGSLRLVGNGKWSVADMKKALDAKDRTQGGETAPAQGLYLTGVEYNVIPRLDRGISGN